MDLKEIRVALLIALAFILMNLVGLDRSPVVWVDEVILNDPAKELALHGMLRSSVFGTYLGFDTAYFLFPPGQPLVTAMIYRVFGFGIWQTRVPVVLFGAGVLVAVYFFTMQLFDSQRAGFFAAILVALDPRFIQTARSGRMDAQCLFLVLLGVILYLQAEADHDRRYFWLACSGLGVGLAGITHQVAVSWAIALGLLILLTEAAGRFKRFALFSIFAALPSILWMAYALRTPQLFRAFQLQFVRQLQLEMEGGSIFTSPIRWLSRYQDAYRLVPLLLVTYALALPWVVFSAKYPNRIRIRVGILFALPFFFGVPSGFGDLHATTVLAVCSGDLVATLLPARVTRPLRTRNLAIIAFLSLLIVNVLLSGMIGRYLALAYQWQARDYRQVEAPILEIIPKGSIVWGPPEVWYAAERAGVSLRFFDAPTPRWHDYAVDPRLDDYVIVRSDSRSTLPAGFVKVQEIGQPLPPVFGIMNLPSADYRMEIWQSETRPLPLSNGQQDSNERTFTWQAFEKGD